MDDETELRTRSPDGKDVLFAAQAPTAACAFGDNVSAAAWKSKPSWYLVATADRASQPILERAMAKNIKAKTIEVAASHVAMLARPRETANLIVGRWLNPNHHLCPPRRRDHESKESRWRVRIPREYASSCIKLYDDKTGGPIFEYDRPSSLFGQNGDEWVKHVGRELDAALEADLRQAAD